MREEIGKLWILLLVSGGMLGFFCSVLGIEYANMKFSTVAIESSIVGLRQNTEAEIAENYTESVESHVTETVDYTDDATVVKMVDKPADAVATDYEQDDLLDIFVSEEFVYSETGNKPCYADTDDYILSDSSEIKLTSSDIEVMTLKELCYARNEIYARHGRKFLSSELQNYFNSKSWYKGLIEASDFLDENYFNQIEKDNVQLLLNREHSLRSDGYPLDKDWDMGSVRIIR